MSHTYHLFKQFASVLLVMLCFQLKLNAQDNINKTKHAKTIDKIFAAWDQADTPGCGLGIIENGKLIYARGYGLANMEYDIPNNANTVFRIGSTSKQFTAACIVLLAEQNKLNLDNSLHQYFPDFPDYAKGITIAHLLNHTSGIRDYLTLTYLKGFGEDDYYTDSDVMSWLVRQTDLNFNPGDEFLYSNSGYWLLGQIVEEVAGMDMAAFAEKEIFQPLGMTDTHFHNDHNQIVKNRASGYSPKEDDAYQISMTTLDMIGDGGIFTSIHDIKKWDDAYYNSKVLGKDFWAMMTKQAVLNNGEEISYASGLMIRDYKGLPTISHGGAFVGFRAEFLRFPAQKLSIAIFANRGDANPTRMAFEVADVFLQDQYIATAENKAVVANEVEQPKEDLTEIPVKQLAGDYEIQAGVVFEITAKGNALNVLQKWNNASYEIVRSSGNTFELPDEEGIYFEFSDLKDNATQVVTVTQGGHESVCERKEEIDLSGIHLEDYTGTYYSKELDVNYSFFVADETLQLRIRNTEAVPLQAIEKDQFFCYGNVIVFDRQAGMILGFEMEAGRVKNLKFEKN